jgi:DUF177 domain-containing protein
MRFKINEIGPDGVPVNVPITAEWLAAACPEFDGRPSKAGLNLTGRITKAGDDYLFRADLRGALETPCARCLEAARVPLEIPLAVTFVSADELDTDDDEDTDIIPFTGGEIDISDEVRDEIVLALPMNPLCTETCRGLCPVCGGNRNQVACACEADRAPPGGGKLSELGKIKL